MDGLLKNVADIRDFFSRELRSVLDKQKITLRPHSVQYLVELFFHYLKSDNFFANDPDGKLQENTLTELYAEYLQGDLNKRKTVLKRLGDICLLVTGFFSDSLSKKLVDVDYYIGMGGGAYWQLSHLPIEKNAELFRDLSLNFVPVSNALGEVSERGGIQSNRDLLRVYERWLMTGSQHLKEKLSEHGIPAPIKTDLKRKH